MNPSPAHAIFRSGVLALGALLAYAAPAFAQEAREVPPWSRNGKGVFNLVGNVGIGTASPGQALEIMRSGDTGVLVRSSGGAAFDQFLHFQDTASDWYLGNRFADDKNGFGIGRTSFKNDLVMDSAGRVGIGTTTPQGRLDVAGNLVLSGRTANQIGLGNFNRTMISGPGIDLSLAPVGGGHLLIVSNTNADQVYLQAFNRDLSQSASEMLLTGANTAVLPRLSLYADVTWFTGNVGIGTASPAHALEIVRSDDAALLVRSTGGAAFDQSIHFQDTASDWYLGNRFADDKNGFGIGRTSFKNDLVMDSAGRVGIGTTAPDAKLTVAGVIHSTGGIQFPDGTTQVTAAMGGGGGGHGPLGVQEFTISMPFDVPADVTSISVEMWGGGGGGATSADGGGGGGAGAYVRSVIQVNPGETLVIVIGAGGAEGVDGGESAVLRLGSSLIRAGGGARGVNTIGGAGGSASFGPGIRRDGRAGENDGGSGGISWFLGRTPDASDTAASIGSGGFGGDPEYPAGGGFAGYVVLEW